MESEKPQFGLTWLFGLLTALAIALALIRLSIVQSNPAGAIVGTMILAWYVRVTMELRLSGRNGMFEYAIVGILLGIAAAWLIVQGRF